MQRFGVTQVFNLLCFKDEGGMLRLKQCWWVTFTYADEGGGTRLCHSECDGMSQCDLTEGFNRLSSMISDRIELTYMIMQRNELTLFR